MRNNKLHIFIILAFFLLFQLFFILQYRTPIWDEGVYIGMGKYLYSGGVLGLWESFRPLVFPLAVGLIWFIGLPIVFNQILTVLLGSGIVYLTYLITKKLYSNNAGYIAAAIIAFSQIILRESSMMLSDIPSLFFMLFAIHLYINNKLFWAGLVASIAFMTKFPHALLIIIFSIRLLINNIKQKNYLSQVYLWSGFIMVFCVFIIYNLLMYPGNLIQSSLHTLITAGQFQNKVYESIPVTGFISILQHILYYPVRILQDSPLSIFGILGIVTIIKQKKYFTKQALIVISLTIYLIYFSIIVYKQDRFMMFLLPFLAILASQEIIGYCNKFQRKFYRKIYLVILILILLVPAGIIASQFNFANEPVWVETIYRDIPDGEILISDPVFAVYNDNKFTPFYFNQISAMKIITESESKNIIYHDLAFVCGANGCEDFNKILSESEFKQTKIEKTAYGATYYYYAS